MLMVLTTLSHHTLNLSNQVSSPWSVISNNSWSSDFTISMAALEFPITIMSSIDTGM